MTRMSGVVRVVVLAGLTLMLRETSVSARRGNCSNTGTQAQCDACCVYWASCCRSSGGTPDMSACGFQDLGGGNSICSGPSCDGGLDSCPGDGTL
jgi:hypothetical protein